MPSPASDRVRSTVSQAVPTVARNAHGARLCAIAGPLQEATQDQVNKTRAPCKGAIATGASNASWCVASNGVRWRGRVTSGGIAEPVCGANGACECLRVAVRQPHRRQVARLDDEHAHVNNDKRQLNECHQSAIFGPLQGLQ
eukprot:7352158-Prymnesium_polylepis.4